jgi:hypothetical protein
MTSAFPISPSAFPPFWYGTFTGLWIYYKVPVSLAQAMLDKFTQTTKGGPGFTAFTFTDEDGPFALANLNFMCYGAQSGSNDPRAYQQILKPVDPSTPPPGFGIEPATETELSIIAYPTSRADQIPESTFSAGDFLLGNDHTKTLGAFRLCVPCDDRIAVYWGAANFGENKFMTYPYIYDVPSPNSGTASWSFIIPGAIEEPNYSFDPDKRTCSPYILQAAIDVSGLAPVPGNPSEILDYSMWKDNHDAGRVRAIGSRRNIFGNFSTYVLPAGYEHTFELGNSTNGMVGILKELLGINPPPYAVQTFQTPPVIAESGTFYVSP